MNGKLLRVLRGLAFVAALALLLGPHPSARAAIHGITGPEFALTATAGTIVTGEGNALRMWGLAPAGGVMQYPGPTLIVSQGATVVVTLTNTLDVPTSLVFPGQASVVTTGGVQGLLTREAPANGGTVTYTFVAEQPGTYLYNSGTDPDVQIEMGLVGALIVRPTGWSMMDMRAYGHADSAYDQEYLFLFTEADPRYHELAATGRADQIDTSHYFPVYWFLNGRNAPDTMSEAGVPWLPNQPYNCMPMIHPGERLLMRIVSAGRDYHPFHTHGNNFTIIARDGRLLESAPGEGADLGISDFTTSVPTGGTEDTIFTWTGHGLGWDMYGHTGEVDNPPLGNFPGVEDVDNNGNLILEPGLLPDLEMGEDPADHGKPFPVQIPNALNVTAGAGYSGSPFLGAMGFIPPGEGGQNPFGGYMYMWHSHNEKEMVNNDIFPGGNMTMLMVVPHGVTIMH